MTQKSQFKEREEELGSVADTYLDIPSGKWSVDFKVAFGRLIKFVRITCVVGINSKPNT